MSLRVFLCVLMLTALDGNALNEERGDKRLEEGGLRNTGSHRSSRQLVNNTLTRVGNLLKVVETILTPTVDWRARGAVTGVKDQGACNSSWAIAAAGSVEATNYFHTRQLVSLSAQQLIDCSSSYGNEGCNGGEVVDAFQSIIDIGGIDSELSYPYKGKVGQCRYNPSYKAAQIKSYTVVTPQGSEDTLLEAVIDDPVAVTVDASHNSIKNYTSGVYYEPLCSQTNLNHAMLVVGYGTNSQGEDYWIVKNSYGTGWGMDGYILMARNRDNNCGIASEASYAIAGIKVLN